MTEMEILLKTLVCSFFNHQKQFYCNDTAADDEDDACPHTAQ
jgi:hypothetical protein